MKIKTLAVATAMIVSSGLASANSYQGEVGATYTDVDGDDGAFGIRGEFHLNPVRTRNLPLAEAAFLQQSSNVYAEANDDFDSLTVGGELYIPDTMFFVGAGVNRISNGGSDTTLFATLGLTPINGLLITTDFTDDGYDANIGAKYVVDLGAGNFANFEGEYRDGDVEDYLRLDADFYFDRTLSIGAGYADNYGGDEFTLRARNFFTEEISAEIAYTDSDWGDRIMIGGAIRF